MSKATDICLKQVSYSQERIEYRAPIKFGGRVVTDVVLFNVAVDVETGEVAWQRHVSVYLSDAPQHRAGWASPAVDRETGNIYMVTVGLELLAFSPAGEKLWTRSLSEEYGAVSTHGGRTTSPIIEGDKVILSTLLMAWGDLGRPGNRFFAFDKRTGQTIWISGPQARCASSASSRSIRPSTCVGPHASSTATSTRRCAGPKPSATSASSAPP